MFSAFSVTHIHNSFDILGTTVWAGNNKCIFLYFVCHEISSALNLKLSVYHYLQYYVYNGNYYCPHSVSECVCACMSACVCVCACVCKDWPRTSFNHPCDSILLSTLNICIKSSDLKCVCAFVLMQNYYYCLYCMWCYGVKPQRFRPSYYDRVPVPGVQTTHMERTYINIRVLI